MALFSSSKRPVFKPSPYETGKRRHRMPRWLAQMLFGAIIGAAGWYFLQNSYGPKRLTVTESQQLTQELNAARLEAQRLRDELDALNSEHSSVRTDAEQWQARANRAEALSGPLQQEIDAAMGASAIFEEKRDAIRTVTRTITREVDRIVERPVYRDVCLDPDGLRVANAALVGTPLAPGQPDGAVPAPDAARRR